MAPRPSDRLLEIGCGRGVAVAAVCERLRTGTILGIDRSATAIAAARRRNADHVRSGRAAFAAVALADLAVGPERFDGIFAVNVNLFWRSAGRELAVVRRVLEPRGRLHLVFEPPTAAQVDPIARRAVAELQVGGFSDIVVRAESGAGRGMVHIGATS